MRLRWLGRRIVLWQWEPLPDMRGQEAQDG